ncbi:RNA-directed DNA polymerase, eukaryota, partial [Tanacetum coccineum]
MTSISHMDVKLLWGNSNYDYVCSESLGNSGGILCIWEASIFKKINTTVSDNFIAIYGTWLPTNSKILFIAIYAPQQTSCKRKLWDYISNIVGRWNGESIIMGDFNESRSSEERRGSCFNPYSARYFDRFISNAGLVDVTLEGYAFTWAHPSASKMSKLDRFLVSDVPAPMVDAGAASLIGDRWFVDLLSVGNFRVKEIRNYIDDLFLPHQAAQTRWIKYIPIKVNIFAWRARQDCLPTRVNLIRRGITIESSLCPMVGLDPHDWSSIPIVAVLGFYVSVSSKELLYLIRRYIVLQRPDHLDIATSCYEFMIAIKMYKIAGEERFLLWAIYAAEVVVGESGGCSLDSEGSHLQPEDDRVVVAAAVVKM